MPFTADHIDHIVITCRDVDATASWYTDVLGMRRETYGDHDRTALVFGVQKLNLRPIEASDWETSYLAAPGVMDFCFVAHASAHAIGEHLRAVGVDVVHGPVHRTGALGDLTSYYCLDPDGNAVEIATYS